MQPTKMFGDVGTLLERESLFHIKDVAIWQYIMLQCTECIAAFRVHCCHHIFQIFLPLWDYYIEIQKPSNIKFKINHQTFGPGLYDKGYISIWLWHLGLNSFHGIWNCTTVLSWCTYRHLFGRPCCNRTLWILGHLQCFAHLLQSSELLFHWCWHLITANALLSGFQTGFWRNENSNNRP